MIYIHINKEKIFNNDKNWNKNRFSTKVRKKMIK